MAVINGDFFDPGLKFIQLKNYQFTSVNESNSGQCFAFDQNNKVAFACCRNELVYVPLNSLLNFDAWTKELLKTVDTQLPERVVIKTGPDSLNCHLVSISSRGYGSKLALCSYDRSQASLFITFYDLKSLYQNKERAVPYSRFNVSITGQDEVLVRMLHWHPEISDNIFACSFTNGSFNVAYISDSDRNVLTVLVHYTTNRHVTSFAWSPKGKQIVVAFRNTSVSHFSQFKLPINEKDLVQNTPFEEVKKINLTHEFKDYYVCNICWLATFNFVIICTNLQTNDTRYMLVSMPSAKAVGNDAIMKIVDFSCINIDSTFENVLEANLMQLDNIIITYTNRSSSFALLGCPTINDIGTYNKWGEITLEDVSNLCLPAIGNENFVSIRGLAFAPGTPKQFRFASSVVKGGPDRHFALTYNAFGHLTLFMCDYETPENVNFLKLPTAPATLIKPIVSPTVQNQAASIVPVSVTVPKTTPALALASSSQGTIGNSTSSFFGGQSTFNFAPNGLSTPLPNKTAAAALQKTVNFSLPQATIDNSVANNQPKTNSLASLLAATNDSTQNSQPKASPVASVTQQQPSAAVASVQTAKAAELNLDHLYVEEIKSNIDEFNKEFKANVQSLKGVLSGADIGTSEQFEKIKYEFDFINRMLDNLGDQFTTLNLEVNELQSTYIDLYYMCEETRSLLDRNTDPKYRNILRQRNLDPITSRKVKEIYMLRDYIDVQLRELDIKFDLEWQEWLQKKRKSSSGANFLSPNHKARLTRSPPTAPHLNFISGKSKDSSIEDDQFLSKMLSKTLANNQRLIDSLKVQIREKGKNNPLFLAKSSGSFHLNDSKNDTKSVHNLSKIFNESMNLNNSKLNQQQPKRTVITCLAPSRKSALKSFLENRRSVPIRVCGPNANDSFSSKSRFVSVLEKIKDKGLNKSAPVSSTLIKPMVSPTVQNQAASIVPVPASVPKTTPALALASSSQGTIGKSTSSLFGSQSTFNIAPNSLSTPLPNKTAAATAPQKTVNFALTPPASTGDNSVANNQPKANSLASLLAATNCPTPKPQPQPQPKASLVATVTQQQPPPAVTSVQTAVPANQNNNPITFSFSKAYATAAAIAAESAKPPASISFSSPPTASPAATENTLNSFSICSPAEPAKVTASTAGNVLGSFSFGGNTAAPAPVSSSTLIKPIVSPTVQNQAASVVPVPASVPKTTPALALASSSQGTIGKSTSSLFGSQSTFNIAPNSLSTPLPNKTAAATAPQKTVNFALTPPAATGDNSVANNQPKANSLASLLAATNDSTQNSQPKASPVASVALAAVPSVQTAAPANQNKNPITFSFSKAYATAAAIAAESAKPASFSFSSPPTTSPAAIENTLNSFSICSPAEPAKVTASTAGNVFGSFSFGGNTAAPNAVTSNASTGTNSLFGSLKANITSDAGGAPGDSIFSSSILNSSSWSGNNSNSTQQPSGTTQSQSFFSTPAQNKTGTPFSFQTGAAVSPVAGGAGAIGFGSPGNFGSSPVFGQSSGLGNTQTFGGTPTFGGAATFGSTSPFSAGASTGFGVGGQAPFSNNFTATNETYGSFAMKDAEDLSFGSFAAESSQPNNGAFNQQQQQTQFNSPAFGHDASFTQRRK